jgi:hypothetical protein
MAFSGGFETYFFNSTSTNPWLIAFDNKFLTGSDRSKRNGHTLVGSLQDLGSSAQFKKANSLDVKESQVDAEVLEVYPNPLQGGGTLSISSTKTLEMVKFYTLSGHLVVVQDELVKESDQIYTFAVCGLKKGLYLMHIKSADQTHYAKLYVH